MTGRTSLMNWRLLFINLSIYLYLSIYERFDEREDELNEWLEALLVLQQGSSNFYGKKPKPNFDVIWQVSDGLIDFTSLFPSLSLLFTLTFPFPSSLLPSFLCLPLPFFPT